MKSIYQLGFRLFFLLIFSQSIGQQNSALSYELKMPEPETHFFEVHMDIDNVLANSKLIDKEHLLVKMPVWTPGSYLIREFAGNVTGFIASDQDGKELSSRKINKNTWEIDINFAEDVNIDYKVFAFDLTVRTSFIDQLHGYLNGASIFMFVPQLMGMESRLTVFPYEKWSTISTALPSIGNNTFLVKDYDMLVDSPIEIGNHEVLEFEALGIPFQVAMFSASPLKYDKEKLLIDYKKMVEAAATVVGDTPIDHYLFIIHHQPGIGGGLEHLYSTTCHTSTFVYETESTYKGLFGTLAHEFFHSWNVKRIRPMALGPFDYEKENYTHMLWVSEGFTNFYEEVILKRAGIFSEEDVLRNQAVYINNIENSAGNKIQSATESSWDAWIKYYRPTVNSGNTTISYYSKGGVLGALLNAKIIANTNSAKSLDDVMRLLYHKYYKELGRGYTDEEFQLACEEVHGGSLDYFFREYVSGTATPDYVQIFKGVGINCIDTNLEKDTKPYLGISERGGYISNISAVGSAYHSGLSVGDQIISIDGQRGISFSKALEGKKVGETMTVKVMRNNMEYEFIFSLERDIRKSFKLEKMTKMTPGQEKAYIKFLN